MSIEKIIKINQTVIPKVKKYKLGYNLLWTNAERNMTGSLNADLIGEFPKIEVEFPDGLTQAEVTQIGNLLAHPFFEVEYWDSRLGRYTIAKYYRGDYEVELMNKNKQLYFGFKVNLIPLEARR